MKEIPLTQGMIALVDDEDYEALMQYKWNCKVKGHRRTNYAVRGKSMPGGKYKVIAMHRVIIQALPEFQVDHINRNGLDNRKENLRLATRGENQRHKEILRNNTSGYKGVSWDKEKKRWRGQIAVNGKGIKLGWFKNKIEAARVYNKAAIKLHREFAVLNQI